MVLHPCEHFIICATGNNYLTQCLGIHSGIAQESSIKGVLFRSKNIGVVGLRQLPFGKKLNLIDQSWK